MDAKKPKDRVISNKLRQKEISIHEIKDCYISLVLYCYLSEKAIHEINQIEKDKNSNFDFSNEQDEVWESRKGEVISLLGFFLPPSQLYRNVLKRFKDEKAQEIEELGSEICRIFKDIEEYLSQDSLKEIFKNINFEEQVKSLGNNDSQRGKKIVKILEAVGEFIDKQVDKLGSFSQIYKDFIDDCKDEKDDEILKNHCISEEISDLVSRIIFLEKDGFENIYDPSCNAGSLLNKFMKRKNLEFFGHTDSEFSAHLCRIGLLMNDVDMGKINIGIGNSMQSDVLGYNQESEKKHKFDVIVTKPSLEMINKWTNSSSRYSLGGFFPPHKKGDWAMVGLCLNHLNEKGVAAVFCGLDPLHREKESEIREYLVNNDLIKSVILLPKSCFGVDEKTWCLLIIKKEKNDGKILFMNVSRLWEKGKVKRLTESYVDKILEIYKNPQDAEYISRWVDKKEIESTLSYSLSVITYIDEHEEMEEIDIKKVNVEISNIENKLSELMKKKDKLINQLWSKKERMSD